MLFKLFIVLFVFRWTEGLENGLVITPPMGWNAWIAYHCNINCNLNPDSCISERTIMSVADRLVLDGYTDAGYEYVIIDGDCWGGFTRHSNTSKFFIDPMRFPNGIKHLADYMHEKGLKLGLKYECTFHDNLDYTENIMKSDAEDFAEWGIDYVKINCIGWPIGFYYKCFEKFGKMLRNAGRPMVYSCAPVYADADSVKKWKRICNLWRIGETHDRLYSARNQMLIQRQAGPGYWNNPDGLLIKDGADSVNKTKTDMIIWAILAAPLTISAKFENIHPDHRELLLNKELIKVNQDRFGIQGLLVDFDNGVEIWTRKIFPSHDGIYSYAIAFINTLNRSQSFTKKLEDLRIKSANIYHAINLFDTNKKLGEFQTNDEFTIHIEPYETLFYKFSLEKE